MREEYINLKAVLDMLGESRSTFYRRYYWACWPEQEYTFPLGVSIRGKRGLWWNKAAIKAWLKGRR